MKTRLSSRPFIAAGHIFRLIAIAILFASLAMPLRAREGRGFTVPWNVLLPVRDYLYLGDRPPRCTDHSANMIAYRRDHTLLICTGGKHGNGWQPIAIAGKAQCATCTR